MNIKSKLTLLSTTLSLWMSVAFSYSAEELLHPTQAQNHSSHTKIPGVSDALHKEKIGFLNEEAVQERRAEIQKQKEIDQQVYEVYYPTLQSNDLNVQSLEALLLLSDQELFCDHLTQVVRSAQIKARLESEIRSNVLRSFRRQVNKFYELGMVTNLREEGELSDLKNAITLRLEKIA